MTMCSRGPLSAVLVEHRDHREDRDVREDQHRRLRVQRREVGLQPRPLLLVEPAGEDVGGGVGERVNGVEADEVPPAPVERVIRALAMPSSSIAQPLPQPGSSPVVALLGLSQPHTS